MLFLIQFLAGFLAGWIPWLFLPCGLFWLLSVMASLAKGHDRKDYSPAILRAFGFLLCFWIGSMGGTLMAGIFN